MGGVLTALDAHYAGWASGDGPARLRYLSALYASELLLLLDTEREESLSPTVLKLDGAPFALAFDHPLRLAAYLGAQQQDHLEVIGRDLVPQIAAAGLGLILNAGSDAALGVIGADEIAWLAEAHAGAELEERPEQPIAFAPLDGADPEWLEGLAMRLAALQGKAARASLVLARYVSGAAQALCLIEGACAEDQPLILALLQEYQALHPDTPLDVIFDAGVHAPAIARAALVLDVPRRAAWSYEEINGMVKPPKLL